MVGKILCRRNICSVRRTTNREEIKKIPALFCNNSAIQKWPDKRPCSQYALVSGRCDVCGLRVLLKQKTPLIPTYTGRNLIYVAIVIAEAYAAESRRWLNWATVVEHGAEKRPPRRGGRGRHALPRRRFRKVPVHFDVPFQCDQRAVGVSLFRTNFFGTGARAQVQAGPKTGRGDRVLRRARVLDQVPQPE